MSTYILLRSVCLFAAAGAFAASATAALPVPPQSVPSCSTGVGCQFPDQQGWALSDDNPHGPLWALDNMKVTANGNISSLCWWGVYFNFNTFADCGPGSGDSFTVTYYNDDSCDGTPGTVRAGPLALTLSNKFATGNFASNGGISMAEYQYEGAHAPVAVFAGECLWLKILNNTTQDCFWLWSTANPGDGRSYQDGAFGPNPMAFDLAFCVDVATTNDGCSSPSAVSYCTAKVNSSGCSPSISASWHGSNLFLDAQQVLAGQTGFLFYSVRGPISAPFQGGFLCAAPPQRRTAMQMSTATGSPPCKGLYTFDFTARIASGKDPALVGGQQVWAQYWSRDMGSPSGTGLTNGLTFTVCH